MNDPTGTVPQRPHLHLLMRLAFTVTFALYTRSQLVLKKELQECVRSTSLFFVIPFTPHISIHIRTYLLIYHLHARMHLL